MIKTPGAIVRNVTNATVAAIIVGSNRAGFPTGQLQNLDRDEMEQPRSRRHLNENTGADDDADRTEIVRDELVYRGVGTVAAEDAEQKRRSDRGDRHEQRRQCLVEPLKAIAANVSTRIAPTTIIGNTGALEFIS